MSETRLNRRTTKGASARPGRSCGSCTLCCTHLDIESEPGFSTLLSDGVDIAKPKGQKCRFLGPGGCTVYEVRPLVCREFACDWLLGDKNFKESDHPLKSRIIGVRGVNWHFEVKV
ncbi:MAG: YkgJ family cysteine cluster protein [Pseudomonadota bacterium]